MMSSWYNQTILSTMTTANELPAYVIYIISRKLWSKLYIVLSLVVTIIPCCEFMCFILTGFDFYFIGTDGTACAKPIAIKLRHSEPNVNCVHKVLRGFYSLNGQTSYRKILWCLKAARFTFRLFESLLNLTDPCRDVCGISERYDHYNIQSRGLSLHDILR